MRPGLWNGCFAVRPTFGAVSVEGFVTCIRAIDMPGFLGRDLSKCREFAAAWYGNDLPKAHFKPISKIIWATEFWNIMDAGQRTFAEEFTRDVEEYLGVKHEKLSFNDEWFKSPADEANGLSLDEYMKDVPNDLWYDGYHALDDFREKYQTKHGKNPYVSPVVRGDWADAKTITKAARDVAVERLAIHREWFLNKVMASNTHNTIVIVPVENISPRYRDDPPTFPRDGHGTMCSYLSPSIGAPELVVPIEQIPYDSKVTGKKEFLPFAVGIVGLPGTDLSLIDMVYECLRKVGRPTSVKTGSLIF